MKIKDIFQFLRLKKKLKSLMVEINETMELQSASETFAKYVCKMHKWQVRYLGDYTNYFCAIQMAFMDGYIKAMSDNGYEFQNGLVKKRHVAEDLPGGALKHFRDDAIIETKEKAVEVLRRVMEKYETSKQNINVIVNDFEKEINEDGDG